MIVALEPLHDALLMLARRLAADVLAAAASASPDELARTRLRRMTRVRLPGPPVEVVDPAPYVEKMVGVIASFPGGVRARELRAMLGLGKRAFLRVADAALATKRIRREGFKAGVRYLLPSS